ncbi:diguanylate cyclase [Teredinibacter waterburyi]|jgi:hypothetical protein|uniref:diguanylate cyclase n=1 Tax=Teredinibacter waterburyi TaxID=1500538 RepID=UPI001FE55EB8|nr:diguanylate cyclase [Teredinibacter waterburyi]
MKKIGYQLLLGCLLAAPIGVMSAAAETVRMVKIVNDNSRYAEGLVKLALSKLDKSYSFSNPIDQTTTNRVIEMMDNDQLDVFWVATSRELEQRMRPVRIPLYRGLLGYRVFMIKQGTQNKFNGISSLADLSRVSLGQGRYWSDTEIMEANGLNVVKVTQYHGLFFMLDGDRFDAFPRGVQEPWAEIQQRPDLALSVEQNILLSYTSPFYLFVQKDNAKLARDLEEGLRIAIADGSFDEYFRNDAMVKSVTEKANLAQRRVIKLKNPKLPENTPVDQPELWVDITTL